MRNRSSRTVQFSSIEGMYGEMRGKAKEVVVNYFVTALGADVASQKFLKQMSPFRDLVSPEMLNSVDELLQRNLDDARVAGKLCNYVLGIDSGSIPNPEMPVFFPSTLVLLYPKEFFVEGGNRIYPRRTGNESEEEGKLVEEWKNHWKITRYQQDGHDVGADFGVNFDAVLPLVIDGQHRTEAFKRSIGLRPDPGNPSVKFNFFYNHLSPSSGEGEWSPSMPVTFVWFSRIGDSNDLSLEDIRRYARKLFLDINTSAEVVSASRNILMDDSDPVASFTRGFYNKALARTEWGDFTGVGITHLGLDYGKSLSGGGGGADIVRGNIVVPEVVNYGFRKLFFAPSNRSLSQISISNYQNWNQISQLELWSEECGVDTLYEEVLLETVGIDEVKQRFVADKGKFDSIVDHVAGIMFDLIAEFPLYQTIVRSMGQVGAQIASNPAKKEVWDRLVISGDSYYAACKRTDIQEARADLEVYEEFCLLHKKECSDLIGGGESVDSLISMTSSGVLFVGIMGAIDFVFSRDVKGLRGNWSEGMNLIAGNQVGFVNLYRSYMKREYVGANINLKVWGGVRNLIYRYIVEATPLEYVNDEASLEDELFDGWLVNRVRAKAEGQNLEVADELVKLSPNWNDSILFTQSEWDDEKADALKFVTHCFEGTGLILRQSVGRKFR